MIESERSLKNGRFSHFQTSKLLSLRKKEPTKALTVIAYTVTGRDEKGGLTSLPVIFSVKSGHVNSAVIRDLHGTIEREKAAAGILITLEKPTKPMIQEAKQAGQFKSDFAAFDRLQIVTVEDILDNKKITLPMYAEMIKKAQTDSGAKHDALIIINAEIEKLIELNNFKSYNRGHYENDARFCLRLDR